MDNFTRAWRFLMSLASTLKRRICPSCLLRVHRFYSAQAAFRHAVSLSESNGSPSSSSDIPTDLSQSISKSKKTKRIPKIPPRNLLEETKVEEYLAEIAASRHIITLVDLTRLRPDRHSDPITPEYEVEYNNLLDKIQQAFNKKQLIQFVDLLDISRPKQRTKSAFAVQIIEQAWGWPSLTVVQRRRRDWSEVETEFFPLNPPQCFLFLGKDGSDLLEFSREYNVHVAFSSKPLGLKVEGLRGALDHLRSHIATLREEIEEDFLTLPTSNIVNSTLLQRVSRISGAFAENFGSKEIRISYKRSNPRSAFVAKRLATQASCLISGDTQLSILTYVPPGVASSTPIPMSLFPHSYALYPFLSTRTIPWLFDAKGAFRLRRVGEWIGVEVTEDVDKTGGLMLGRGRLIDLKENVKDLRQLVQNLFMGDSTYTQEVHASMGHLLLPSPQASILPPLKGSWPLGKGLNWISSHRSKHIFTTSLPAALLESRPGNRSIKHRLVYQALPTVIPSQDRNQVSKVIKFEMTLSTPGTSTPPPRITMDDSGVEALETKGERQGISSFPRQCSLGSETVIDMMLPDRPMDIRLLACEFRAVAYVEWPRELRAYADAVTSFLNLSNPQTPQTQQPDTPLMLQYEDDTFMLRSSSNVRQNQEIIDIPGSDPIHAVTENVLDLEANQKTTLCQLTCQDIHSDDGWREFLGGCDYLSSFPRKKKARDFLE